MNNVDMETMERWTIRKARQFNNKGNGGKHEDISNSSTSTDLYSFFLLENIFLAKGRKPSLSKWKFCVHADKRAMLREMTSHIRDSR